MKRTLLALTSLSAVLLASTAVQAADTGLTASLKVIGELTTPSCEITVDNNGTYDFGAISSTLIQQNAETTLNPMTKTWTVTCDADTYMNISTTDERADTNPASQTWKFGLGSVNDTGKLGYYTVVLSNAKVDDKDAMLFNSTSSLFVPSSTAWLYTDQKAGWATSSANTQASGRVFQADFAVTPTLASSTTMGGAITDNVNLDGSLTLNFAYGI